MKTFKEYMNIRPGDDSPMGATVHHYGASKPHLQVGSDISPHTIQIFHMFQSQSGPAPEDPADHVGVTAFRGWPEKIQQQVLIDIAYLMETAPTQELKDSLDSFGKFLTLIKDGDTGHPGLD